MRTGTAPVIPAACGATDIPIGARILSVVDCYDALTSDRPYRRALDRDAAVAILLERRGTMYDPLIVDTFIRILPEIAGDRAAARSATRPRSRRSASRHRFRSRRHPRRLPMAGDDRLERVDDLRDVSALA